MVIAIVTWTGWSIWAARRYQRELTAVDAEMAAGRFGLAARRLETMLSWKPDSDEAAYVLGICEQRRGRNQAADLAWARVAPGSAFSQRATIARLRLFHDFGHVARAEQLLTDAAGDPRNDRSEMLVMLVPIFSEIGRSREAERLIEERWEKLNRAGEATQEESIKLVRLHIELTWKAPSVEALRLLLDQFGRVAPDDDRVWLGRASLATTTRAFDEAGRWLDACQRRRPDDVSVWKARLSWAVASDRVGAAQEALQRIPAAEVTPAEILRVRAWFCARRGDVDCERGELERLVAADPADRTALDRLAALAGEAGQPDRAAEFRARKAEIDRLTARYLELYERVQPIRDAEELAELAEKLGRPFEARVFLHLALLEEPERVDLRRNSERLGRLREDVTDGLKGQKQTSPRQRPGKSDSKQRKAL